MQKAVSRLEKLFQILISIGLAAGFYYVARYQSPPGKVFLLGKNVLSLAALGIWVGLLLLWILFLTRSHKKISIRWRAAIYALLLVECTPYLFSFGIIWPHHWPRSSPNDMPGHEWCYPGYIFLRQEYNVCGKQNAEGRYDQEFSLTPAPGVYRAAYLGNSHVEGRSIPLEKKASKLAQASLNQQLTSHRFEIMDFYIPAMRALEILTTTRGDLQKHGVQHVILKSMGVEDELLKPVSAEDAPPTGLYQNAFLQRLIHVPFSNLLSLLAWNGLRMYIELYNPGVATISSEPAPTPQLKEWVQSQCGIENPRMIHKLAVYLQGIQRSYQSFKSVDLGSQKMTIVQIPQLEPLILSNAVLNKYETCQTEIHQRAFEEAFAGSKTVNFVDVTPMLAQYHTHVSEIYFPADRHLNQLGNQIVGEAIAQGTKWYF